MEVNDITLARILECMGPQHGAIKALAEYIGISGNAISNWKLGKTKSYMRYLPQIARFYNVSEAYLRGEVDIKDDHMIHLFDGLKKPPIVIMDDERDGLIMEIMDLFLNLPPKAQEEAKRYLRYLAQQATEENP